MEGELKLTGHSAGAACPTCGKAEVFEHPDGQLRHCFSCGVDFTSVMPRGVEEVVEDIFKASRQHLSDSDEARKYLVEQRGLDPIQRWAYSQPTSTSRSCFLRSWRRSRLSERGYSRRPGRQGGRRRRSRRR
jgi:hypothetical protein